MIKKILFTAAIVFPFLMNSQCNLNFESGSLSGWTVSRGNPDLFTNYNMTGCCATPGSTAVAVYATPMSDPYLGTLPQSPLGGSFIAQVNNLTVGGFVSRITNTFMVTTNNIFQFALAGVIDGITENCQSIAYAHVRLFDNTGTPFYSTHYVPVGPNTSTCSFPAFTNTISVTAFFCWQTYSVNLTPYIGTNVSIEVTSGNCGGTGHFGYCYFDAACSVTTPTPTSCPMVTNVKEIKETESVFVFPNPAKDILNISIERPIAENNFIVYDVLGKIVLMQKDLKHDNKINIEKLIPGTYIYKLVGTEEIKTGKFIKE